MPEQNENYCALCGRELAEPISKHRLIPPSKGGKDTPTVAMHSVCQNKIGTGICLWATEFSHGPLGAK